MMDEDDTCTPLSTEPLYVAQRLRSYLTSLSGAADREREAIPHHHRPGLLFGRMEHMMTHVLRLEYHLRCFILFLAAELIGLGRASEPPQRRAKATPRGLTLVHRQEAERRELLRELPSLNSFKVLTPVIENRRRRHRRRSLPGLRTDPLKLVDAGHLFARLKRMHYVLANADKFAMSLATRAVMATAPPSPLVGEGQRGKEELHEMQFSRAGERGLFETSSPHPNPSPQVGGASEPFSNTPLKHPLYFEPLANWVPPAEHYDSADPEQKRDLTLIHYLASSRLEEIGLGVRPDPYAGLPDLSCLDPKPPPRIRSLL